MSSKQIKGTNKKRSLPRWILVWIDLFITAVAFFVSWACMPDKAPFMHLDYVWLFHLVTLLFYTSFFLLIFRCYDSLWRYQESREYLMQLLALMCSNGLMFVTNGYLLPYKVLDKMQWEYPQSVHLMTALLSLLVMWMFRFVYRFFRMRK